MIFHRTAACPFAGRRRSHWVIAPPTLLARWHSGEVRPTALCCAVLHCTLFSGVSTPLESFVPVSTQVQQFLFSENSKQPGSLIPWQHPRSNLPGSYCSLWLLILERSFDSWQNAFLQTAETALLPACSKVDLFVAGTAFDACSHASTVKAFAREPCLCH